jgi:hypothetical protein
MRRRTTRIAKAGAIAAAVLGASLWVLPAWGSVSVPPPAAEHTSTGSTSGAMAATSAMGASTMASGDKLTQQLAAARQATAKYATNLARAKADGYQIITMMMPNMGYHFMNAHVQGFNVRKPQILVYEHTGQGWQLGALEWVFPKMPKTPPLQNATFGSFPAACHYRDGTFVPDQNAKTCPKTAPRTGARFTFWHPDLVTMHVWVWYPNPAGLYSSTNPLVAPFNGG